MIVTSLVTLLEIVGDTVSNLVLPSSSPNHIAYSVTDDFVKIGNMAYPITHSFIVGERWAEPDWIDTFDGLILECYNCAAFLPAARPGSTYSMYCAHTHINGAYPLSPQYNIWAGQWVWDEREGRWVEDFINYVSTNNTGLAIGSISSVQGWNIISATRSILNIEYRGIPYFPDTSPGFLRAYDPATVGAGNPLRLPNPYMDGDYVFWLYANNGEFRDWDGVNISIQIPPFYNFHNPGARPSHANIIGTDLENVNDDVFQPRSTGLRIISNRYKYAPWERYPHLP